MPRLGVRSKFYVNGGSYEAASWFELPLISDLTINGSWDEGDASTRQSRIKMSEPTMISLEVTGKIRVHGRQDYPAYTAMRNAYYQDNYIDILVLNGALNEPYAEGYRFEGKVFNWSEDQSLGAVLYKDFSIKPCIPSNSSRVPFYADVSAIGLLFYSTMGLGGT